MRQAAALLALLSGCAPSQEPLRDGGPEDSAPTAPACAPGEAPSPFGPTVSPAAPSPPIAGGTLLITRDGLTAVAADPDNAQVWLVDARSGQVRGSVPLRPDDEPGRIAEDGAGRVHVVLRRAGALLTVELANVARVQRRPVCSAPRGVAWDPALDAVHVACAGGELVTLPASGGSPTRTVRLDPDLRDVIIDQGRLRVSRFRSAELLTVDADGAVIERVSPAPFQSPSVRGDTLFSPRVAWRTIPFPGGGALMVHQRGVAASETVDDTPEPSVPGEPPPASPYGGAHGKGAERCQQSGIVHSAVTLLGPGGAVAPALPDAALPVDVALVPFSAATPRERLSAVVVSAVPRGVGGGAVFFVTLFGDGCAAASRVDVASGTPVAVAASDSGILILTREPASIVPAAGGAAWPLTTALHPDSGHAIFHGAPGGEIACASCHPEGGDDGQVWRFPKGARRTQSLGGGLLATAPFHWSGDMPDLNVLTHEVFTLRMGGSSLRCDEVAALGRWLDQVAVVRRAVADPAAVARGWALFTDPAVDCASCHTGPHLTSNLDADVGTGGRFQVPSLVGLGTRAPYLHDGCAATLRDRFGKCGGGDAHGHTSQLAPAALDDLIAYLDSL
jgi:hypothetical protein